MANITTQTIRVDLSTGKIIPTAYTHQNDTARTFIFDMYNGGLPYTMTGNTSNLEITMPSGASYFRMAVNLDLEYKMFAAYKIVS